MTKECAAKGTHAKVASMVQALGGNGQTLKVLDIPCGEGAFLGRPELAGHELHGCDVQNFLADRSDINFVAGNMDERLPYPDEFFDVVVCIDGIEHIKRQFDFVAECHRILKKGGHLVVSTPNISAMRSRWRFFLTGHHNKCKAPLDENNVTPYHHINMISLPELRYVLHTNRFKLTEITANRVKPVSYVYLPYWPLSWLFTQRVYAKELKTLGEKAIGRQVLRDSHRLEVFLGETLIVSAVKS